MMVADTQLSMLAPLHLGKPDVQNQNVLFTSPASTIAQLYT